MDVRPFRKKTIEQYYPVVRFIVLYKVDLTFQEPVDEILKYDTTQKKATEKYFHVVLLHVDF